jgi:uncharacterized FAD-dependent dehydrogenase
MGPLTKQLIDILDEIIAVLDEDKEAHWNHFIATTKSRLLNSDYSGVEHLLSGFGGMGSFSDLVVGQESVAGEFRWKEGYRESNERLDTLRSEAYRVANCIKHNHQIK